jgi:hypothetical protein
MCKKHNILIVFLLAALCAISISFHLNHKRLKRAVTELKQGSMQSSCFFGKRALTIMKYFAPKNVVGKNLIRLGRAYDGGYVMVDDFGKCNAAYSFGISQDVSWDLDIARRGIDVFMYDHTIKNLPLKNEHFHFFKTGICGTCGEDANLKTLEEILTENGHMTNQNLVLKIDVEGAEWEAFSKTPSEIIENFSQIAVEFHGVDDVYDENKFNTILSVLKKLNVTHQVVHVHANNYGTFNVIGGVPLPNTFEVTYLRRRDNQFVPSYKCYPVQDLDMPCKPDTAELFLGFYGMFAN